MVPWAFCQKLRKLSLVELRLDGCILELVPNFTFGIGFIFIISLLPLTEN